MTTVTGPRFTLVSAAHNVGRYLPDFFGSIEAQVHEGFDFEVIVVDDGSTDDTGPLLDAWAAKHPTWVRIVHQANAGQGAARNAAIELARGEWISFPDPDDVLEPHYLTQVAAFLDQNPDVDLVACNRLMWFEAKGPAANTHPLRYMFNRDQRVDLDRGEGFFTSSAAAAFVRVDRVREHELRFSSEVRPIFEDGHFLSRYLLMGSERPTAGFLRTAKYHYRRRADESSTMQTGLSDTDRYDRLLRYGYLDLLRVAREQRGRIPLWLQHQIVFDMSYYFTRTDSEAHGNRPTEGPAAETFHALLGEILGALDVDLVVPSSPAPLQRMSRYALQYGYRDQPWHENFAALDVLDERQRLVLVTYTFTGPAPAEELRCDGVVRAANHAKYRNLTFCGRTVLRQRMLWVPARQSIQLSLDGKPVDLVFQRPPFPRHRINPGLTHWQLSSESGRVANLLAEHADPVPTTPEGRRALRDRDRPKVVERYRNAWVLMDRIHDAGDSGEILFRHLRATHPEINAWFVIEKGTADWRRLRSEGYADRLVAHGSAEWRLLMAHCLHLISSHADQSVIAPPAIAEFTTPRWANTFLNHGIIKDDLSEWLSRKPLSTFVTSSVQEYASIAGDDTPYLFTSKEVVNTGMPRFDRLLEVGRRFPADKRDLVLVAPTWRSWLVLPVTQDSQRRTFDTSALESDFVRQWLALLNSPELAESCRKQGVTLGFLPHPNLQPLLPHLDLPGHVTALTYDGNDVQEYFARARVLVTDFSSIAFNAAYLERPTVYFQFDEDRVREGGHVGRKGYFDYRRDGFGPVETEAEGAAAAIRAALEHGAEPQPAYQARIDATFPLRDGGCSERVVQAVRNSIRPQGGAEPTPTPVPPPPISSDG